MVSRSAGILFDPLCGFWIPDEFCSRAPLLFEPEQAAKIWFRSISTIDGVERTNGVPDLVNLGIFAGPICVGENCGTCGKQLTTDVDKIESAG